MYPYNYYPNNFMQNNFMQNSAQQNLIKVTGMEGAKAYQMPPNSVTALFDANNAVFYIKSTDGAGFPTINAFSFSPLVETKQESDFVTRDEFKKLYEMVLNIQKNEEE